MTCKIRFYTLITSLLIYFNINYCYSNSNKLSPKLLTALSSGATKNIFISFTNTKPVIQRALTAKRYKMREHLLEALYSDLRDHMEISQQKVSATLLRARKSNQTEPNFKRFWSTNQMMVENADLNLVNTIAMDQNVKLIAEEDIAELHKENEEASVKLSVDGRIQWNIQKVGLPEAWAELGDKKGQGVILAIIDDGVRGRHEALRDNFLGEYGWFDPIRNKERPTYEGSHGTHVLGIAVGRKGIGAAPNAKWAACLACDPRCRQRDLSACMEFFLRPTLPNGTNPDFTKVPHIISNSWGSSERDGVYDRIIELWRAVGIIPVFSAGNRGPCCDTLSYPGYNENVINVGNLKRDDTLNEMASVGPAPTHTGIKPDLVAPGTGIFSAGVGYDEAYVNKTGSSMSAPLVAGTIAVLLSYNKELTFDKVRDILRESSDQESLQMPGSICCKNTNETVFPNVYYGYGRLNALKAAKNLKELKNYFFIKSVQ